MESTTTRLNMYRLPCAAHTLQLVVVHVIFGTNEFADIVKAFRTFAYSIRNSSLLTGQLNQILEEDGKVRVLFVHPNCLTLIIALIRRKNESRVTQRLDGGQLIQCLKFFFR